MDRRQFLSRTSFFVVATAASSLTACGGDDDGEPLGRYAFPQGVASGDPREASLVFWSRCVRTDGSSGDVAVRLQVSTSDKFDSLLADVPLSATAAYDYTVRAKVTGLPAATRLYYRFAAGADKSAAGRAKTAPAAGAAVPQLRFAWFSCQDWSVNHWAAMDLLAAEDDLDFVVHVGDYIYETVGAAFQSGAAEAAHTRIQFPDGTTLPDGSRYATTLADYRTLYRTYRGDARLQAIHAKFPMVATWDDHEFSDDCWQDHQTYTNENKQETARRRAANQAWVEYMPVDFGDVSFDSANAAYDNLRIYRDFRFGSLIHLVMTDERLYRDDHVVSEAAIAQAQGHDPVNGSDSIGARYFVQQPVLQQLEAGKTQALGRAPSILGAAQTAWWKQTLLGSSATWKVWGNEIMLSRMWADLRALAPAPYDAVYVVNCDGWDGFPSHRAELMQFITSNNIHNVVAITGDLHAFQCGVVRDNPDPAVGKPALVDFVGAGISSSSFYSYVKVGAGTTPLAALAATPEGFDGLLRANNPDFAYVDHDAQGYASATVTPSSLNVVYTKVKPLNADGTAPASPVLKRTRITLAAGSSQPVVQDNV
ncbi:alkaline phosphatase D family protein [Ramlibacter sp. H39-3-26]|uniref:alkaline phosphatase D family protein n=1 Tax=Curvibacter soli TaxID=3031331 RepID=UPI0023DC8A97|nr:alkaline phosphatase D family protein [Ramlibacter sp. H39-3-26]MDF1484549.1 alkaline phosphatase D family protein [Ramlibacter sp. H39-3-26]